VTTHPVHTWRGKAQFGHIYNRADPRGYFQTLRELEYQAPAHGKKVFTHLVNWQREHLKRRNVVVLDLCCSYGVNAALLNHHLTLNSLYDRYCSPELAALATDELITADRAFYGERRQEFPVPILGIDVAEQAVVYAQKVGLHWAGSSENLETQEPSGLLSHLLAQVNLITVTGGIGYITERTFDRVLQHAANTANCWVAAFALRWVNYKRIAKTFAHYGLTTEKLPGHTFRQRRFASDDERHYVLRELASLGIDPTGKEADGWYHANFYLSYPAERKLPSLHQLVAECGDAGNP
jgi:hypothetical protein